MISASASDWVDMGEPPEPKIAKTLRHFIGFDAPVTDAVLLEYARTLLGMVAADAGEAHVSSYLGSIEEEHGRTRSPHRYRRGECGRTTMDFSRTSAAASSRAARG